MIDLKSPIDNSVTLDGVNPELITVGEYCVIGARSALLTHCPIRGAKPVVIEDYVWIGYGVLVLPGVTVGRCSVVGAGSVVTRDTPPYSVVVGNPARVLRSLTEWEQHSLEHRLRNQLPMGKKEQPNDV